VASTAGGAFGFASGLIIQEFGYDDDVDETLRQAVEAETGTTLVDEDYEDVADSADSSKERIRSTLVVPHTESVIELVFSTGAGVYRVRRTPTYERAKRRGQGTTTQNGTVKLWHLAEVGGEPLDEPVTRAGARAGGVDTLVASPGSARAASIDSYRRTPCPFDSFPTPTSTAPAP